MRSTLPLFALAFAISAPALAAETVPVAQFRSVQLRGGGIVDVVPGPVERVTIVEGSSEFTRTHVDYDGKLVIDTCNERCPTMYRMRVVIQSPRVPGTKQRRRATRATHRWPGVVSPWPGPVAPAHPRTERRTTYDEHDR